MGDRPPVASHPANGVFHNLRGDQRPKRQGQQRAEMLGICSTGMVGCSERSVDRVRDVLTPVAGW
jgi:hypothetical protein